MSFLFRCPHCQSETIVEDKYAGQEGPCFACGKSIQMPELESDNLVSAASIFKNKRHDDFRRLRNASLITIALLLMGGAIWFGFAYVVIPFVTYEAPRRKLAESRERLEKIANAMIAYHADYGTLPPAYVADASGQPAHSWRVLLLPYLGEQSLYAEYSFDEPWNGPNNSALLSQIPDVYVSPFESNAAGFGETSFVVVVGPGTAFPGSNPVALNRIVDGRNATILVAEVADSRINWLQPRDLSTSRMRFVVNRNPTTEISSEMSGGALVVAADGQSYVLPDQVTPTELQALLSIGGGEMTQFDGVGAR